MHSKILQFWHWFTQNEAIFRNLKDAKQAKDLLDNQILSFGRFAWGIDEGPNHSFILTISPNQDKKLFQISQQLINLAPVLPNWTFLHCKPPLKDWDFKFQTFNQFYILQTYDASKWQFVLIEETDYRISIEIKATNMANIDFDEQEIAAQRVVINILGEQLYIKEVYSVKIVSEFDPRDKDWIYPLPELGQRFLYFIE